MRNLFCLSFQQTKLFSDSESIQARAEAAVLLKQLDVPVSSFSLINHL